ncbi:MAG TPA: PHB depolymerase family esterase [Thermoclostridium sp.]|nr:PHB depolymerase family esterase [Thermoclostridium sp.]
MEKDLGFTDNFRSWWDIKRIWGKNPKEQPNSLRELLNSSANRYYDSDKLVNSEFGDELVKIRKAFFLSEDQMSKEVVQYWAQRGLRKELVDGPEEWNKWAIFTPNSALKEENKDRKYPLIFALHGGGAGPGDGSTIFSTESEGYAELAAEHELILGVLDNHWDEGIMALYDYLVKNYPVDVSRVYLTGFSAGGNRATQTSLLHPELFAGILVGAGLPFSFDYDESLVENAAKYRIPMIGIGGTHDKGNTIPFSTTNPIDNPLPEIVARLFGADNKMRWANAFFKLNHIDYYSHEENLSHVSSSNDEVEQIIGIKVQHSKITYEMGQKHYWAEFTDKNGLCLVKYIYIDNLPHCVPPNMMNLGWEFLSKFSRDPISKELIYNA